MMRLCQARYLGGFLNPKFNKLAMQTLTVDILTQNDNLGVKLHIAGILAA